ncbi:MAG: hypothetical protein ABSD41_05445, partial [Candidatus Bathyarchaeia archaeon]
QDMKRPRKNSQNKLNKQDHSKSFNKGPFTSLPAGLYRKFNFEGLPVSLTIFDNVPRQLRTTHFYG